jgi:tetratricopeptide (TPR) repeat protein
MDTSVLDQLSENVYQKDWLESNNQELYDICRALLRQNQLDRVIDALLKIIPQTLYFEDVKRWGKLLEMVFFHTPYAQSNGVEGLYNTSEIYVFLKRAKVPQLPTKTKRNKRIIIHPTEMAEIYWILFLEYADFSEISSKQLLSMLNFTNKVGDSYLSHKTHSTFAFIYLKRQEWDQAIIHAEIASLYWRTNRLMLEDGLNSYLLGMALYHKGSHSAALQHIENASSALLNTSYKMGYFVAELIAIAFKIAVDGISYDTISERFNIALTMLNRQLDGKQAKQVIDYVQSEINLEDGELELFQQRLKSAVNVQS